MKFLAPKKRIHQSVLSNIELHISMPCVNSQSSTINLSYGISQLTKERIFRMESTGKKFYQHSRAPPIKGHHLVVCISSLEFVPSFVANNNVLYRVAYICAHTLPYRGETFVG